MLSYINDILALEIGNNNEMTCETGFGNVLCREHRWDLYLRDEGICHEVLVSLIGHPDSILNQVFRDLFCGYNAEFHELSALVSDPGASSQPIHPDSIFTTVAPMYTVFVALQDIDENMGPTIFLPRSNTKLEHDQLFSKKAEIKSSYLCSAEYRQSLLRKGDITIMDSRTLHCGNANYGSRRVLFYLTLRNPLQFSQCIPPIPSGSMWADLNLQLINFIPFSDILKEYSNDKT